MTRAGRSYRMAKRRPTRKVRFGIGSTVRAIMSYHTTCTLKPRMAIKSGGRGRWISMYINHVRTNQGDNVMEPSCKKCGRPILPHQAVIQVVKGSARAVCPWCKHLNTFDFHGTETSI